MVVASRFVIIEDGSTVLPQNMGREKNGDTTCGVRGMHLVSRVAEPEIYTSNRRHADAALLQHLI